MQLVSTTPDRPKDGDLATYDPRPCLYLDDDLVEKLGLTGIPAPGTVFTLQARAVAQSVTASVEEPDEGEGNKPDVRVHLVLTDIGLQQGSPMTSAQQANALYGS